ncbi:hypothetical protein CL689_01985, partial [Candidatus Saccharibacteria bacterium]|nr:hypothetical protein [Candidatus Saccharibacteria bacterium]
QKGIAAGGCERDITDYATTPNGGCGTTTQFPELHGPDSRENESSADHWPLFTRVELPNGVRLQVVDVTGRTEEEIARDYLHEYEAVGPIAVDLERVAAELGTSARRLLDMLAYRLPDES